MVLLQPKLSLKVAQRQILTPGLMQMVSVLALNKLELKEMLNAEIVENPVLEELEESVPLLDDIAGREGDRDRSAQDTQDQADQAKKDPFDEIDFGSYFQNYLDPGFRSPNGFELSEKPSFENFLSQPGTLTDHLYWQLGSLNVLPQLREAAEYVIGNLNEDGYLLAEDEELLAGFLQEVVAGDSETPSADAPHESAAIDFSRVVAASGPTPQAARAASLSAGDRLKAASRLAAAVKLVQDLDPPGIATRTLRECLLVQIHAQRDELQISHGRRPEESRREAASGATTQENARDEEAAVQAAAGHEERGELFTLAERIVDKYLHMLQKRDIREISRTLSSNPDLVQRAIDFIRTLDPRPGQRYNRSEARLIEPDVAFVKRGDEYVVVMNEEDLPTLRLNQGYRKLLSKDGVEKDVKDYVKERYRSALQLMRNIDQRKNTILRTCEAIVRRQDDFLEKGVDAIRPMMIKEVAEEIGVHPSTVSRAVSGKYVHTSQGVFELRFFFSEGANGPEGNSTPLMLLKRKVKKLIDEEDPRKPLTDDLIAHMLQTQGIEVTRRTVAKYREDLRIPSTHQRRVRD